MCDDDSGFDGWRDWITSDYGLCMWLAFAALAASPWVIAAWFLS